MKKYLFLTLAFTATQCFGQGLDLLPKETYKKLNSPPMLCGAAAPGSDNLPDKYVIPANTFPTPGNQGQQPSCTAWATGYALMSFYHGNIKKWELNTNDHIFSPSYLYQNIKGGGNCANCTCGSYISSALDFLKKTGIVSLSDCPYDASDCSIPSANLKTTAGQYKIVNWFRVEDINNLTDIKTYLSQDVPVIIAAYTDKAFSEYYNKKDNEVFHWKSGSYKGGAHAMLAVGYDNTLGAVKVLNSWGTGWGSKGYVWIDYESFRTMVMEAYVVEKNYTLSDDKEPEPVIEPVTTTDITEDHFQLYGYSEEVREGRYHYTFGFDVAEDVQDRVSKVVYVYDDPSFRNKYSTSVTKPNFTNSYEGWGCLPNMQAIIYLTDGTTMAFEFDACQLIEEHASDEEVNTDFVEIIPVITAEDTDEPGMYNFTIELRGIEHIKEDIEKVVYDRNHESFKQRYVSTYDRGNNFAGGYTGWGCLESMNVIIYYYDGTTDTFEINMCDELGW